MQSEEAMPSHHSYRSCVVPSPTEQELAVLPGEPGMALRVRVEAGARGYVRLEQLAYNAELGWYAQKSFCIPAHMLAAVATELRKADCLTGGAHRCEADCEPIPLFPCRLPPPEGSERASGRRA